MQSKLLSMASLASLMLMGCTSATSTFMSRQDDDRLTGQSNGLPMHHCSSRPQKGIPITVRVPTHVDIEVYEKLFYDKNTFNPVASKTGRHLEVRAKEVYTPKVFTIDPKRACAGTSDYLIEFNLSKSKDPSKDNSQYPGKINNQVVDKTIEDITTSIKTLAPTIKKAIGTAGGQKPGEPEPSIFGERERMVAWKRFDINDPAFEENLRSFVSHHVNNCNSCCQDQTLQPPVEHIETTYEATALIGGL